MLFNYPLSGRLPYFSRRRKSGLDRFRFALTAIIFGGKYEVPRERTTVKLDPKVLTAYVGQYEDRPGRVATILVENDTLLLKLPGRPEGLPLMAESATQFFHPVQDIQIAFVKDANGQVTEVTLRLNGREFHAKKIK